MSWFAGSEACDKARIKRKCSKDWRPSPAPPLPTKSKLSLSTPPPPTALLHPFSPSHLQMIGFWSWQAHLPLPEFQGGWQKSDLRLYSLLDRSDSLYDRLPSALITTYAYHHRTTEPGNYFFLSRGNVILSCYNVILSRGNVILRGNAKRSHSLMIIIAFPREMIMFHHEMIAFPRYRKKITHIHIEHCQVVHLPFSFFCYMLVLLPKGIIFRMSGKDLLKGRVDKIP